jgi:hypothetical protein
LHGNKAYSAWSFALNSHGIRNDLCPPEVMQGLGLAYLKENTKGFLKGTSLEPPNAGALLSPAEVTCIVETIANELSITPEITLALVYCFFICGGHNTRVPLNFTVSIPDTVGGGKVFLQKSLLMDVFNHIARRNKQVKRKRIRTLGESLGPCISQYAVAHSLQSELSDVLNTLSLALGFGPLTDSEKGHALSTSDKNLEAVSIEATPHLAALMYVYLQLKFN